MSHRQLECAGMTLLTRITHWWTTQRHTWNLTISLNNYLKRFLNAMAANAGCATRKPIYTLCAKCDDLTAFSWFRENATIPSLTANPSHPENLFPLCVYCHEGYFFWLGSHTWCKETLHTYIDHEKNLYEQRYLVSQKSRSVPPRSLPFIVRNKFSAITQPTVVRNYLPGDTHWPKRWLGEPATVIHRAAVCHGLFQFQPYPTSSLGTWQNVANNWCSRYFFGTLVGEPIGFVGKAATGGPPGQKPDSESKATEFDKDFTTIFL